MCQLNLLLINLRKKKRSLLNSKIKKRKRRRRVRRTIQTLLMIHLITLIALTIQVKMKRKRIRKIKIKEALNRFLKLLELWMDNLANSLNLKKIYSILCPQVPQSRISSNNLHLHLNLWLNQTMLQFKTNSRFQVVEL